MAARVVRLGTPRAQGEGTRIGTVRRPPRGVPKERHGPDDWYDVWFPNLAPSVETMKLAQRAATDADWKTFARRYRAEMSTPENSRTPIWKPEPMFSSSTILYWATVRTRGFL